MADPVENPADLPGREVADQMGQKLGEVKEVYKQRERATWVALEVSTGLIRKRTVFVPLARLKEEDDQLRVPYRGQHIKDAPDVEPRDELSEEDDRLLRDHYGIDRADQELREDNEGSYAAQAPEGTEPEPIKKDNGAG